MRKGFNFYRSYWEVANELNDKDRLAFYDALLKKQFTNIDSELNGMVKFAYLSQKHSIDKQIDGYVNKTIQLHPNKDPWQGGSVGASVDPWQQEKEQEKEKEEVKEQIDFQALLDFINLNFKREFKVVNNKVKSKYKSLINQGYSKQQVLTAIINCKNNEYHKEKNYQYCTPEFFSRTDTIDKYGFDTTEVKDVYFAPVIHE
jgi:hypothetical protein